MEIIGNTKTKNIIDNWLAEFFQGFIQSQCPKCKTPVMGKSGVLKCSVCGHEFDYTRKKYIIIYGESGNGKTYICKYFAEKYGVDLFTITPEDILDDNDLNNYVKSINLSSLDGGSKIILIDDFNEFAGAFGKRVLRTIKEEILLSRFPVIFTCREYPKYDDFVRDSVVVGMYKPFPNQLVPYLKSINKRLSDQQITEIAEKAKSFRSAETAVLTSFDDEIRIPYLSTKAFLKSINERNLSEPLSIRNIRKVFNSVSGLDDKDILVMERFAYFDYRIRRFKGTLKSYENEVDPFFVNHMKEPIDDVVLQYQYKRMTFNSKNNKNKNIVKPISNDKQPSIDGWL